LELDKISDTLATSPHPICNFSDDELIKEFLVEIGANSHFKIKPEGSKETAQILSLNTHRTHFILIGLFLGHDDQKQNGYSAWFLSKKNNTPEGFLKFIDEVQKMAGHTVLGGHPVKYHNSN
jgi:hypothetical protein